MDISKWEPTSITTCGENRRNLENKVGRGESDRETNAEGVQGGGGTGEGVGGGKGLRPKKLVRNGKRVTRTLTAAKKNLQRKERAIGGGRQPKMTHRGCDP